MLTRNELPMLRRKLFEPLIYCLNRSPRFRYWQKLEKTQFLQESELKSKQWKRLQSMLSYVWGNNGFYQEKFAEAGVLPDMVQSPEDLRLIPFLTKEEIRRNTPAMISRGFRMDTLQHYKTGGSTGKALDIYVTEECSELRNACALRHDRWAGWEVGEPIGACWGNPHLPVSLKDKLKGWLLEPFIYLDTMSVDEASVRKFVRDWETVKATLLYGHAHSIYVLAVYLSDLGIDSIRPKGILSTSMMLIPSERRVIEKVFGIKVTDRYGCEEVSLIGSECERHEGLHLNIEHLFVEFIKDDGLPAGPGESGRIVVTDLMNKAMPFIRYHVEDVGIPTDRKCSCGRGLPLMEQVTGRVADFLIKKDGTRVAGVSLIENTLTLLPGLDQMQILQNGYEDFLVRIVPGVEFNNSIVTALKKYFADIFGKFVKVEVSLVEKIMLEKSGKYRFSICKIPKEKVF